MLSAAYKGDVAKVARLIAEGKDVNVGLTKGRPAPLHRAAEQGHVDVARLLLSHGADVNQATDKEEWTPLHMAACFGHCKVALVLIRGGAAVNAQTKGCDTPLQLAAEHHHIPMVKLLLAAGAVGNPLKRSLLSFASEGGFVHLAKVLLEWGACVTDDIAALARYHCGAHCLAVGVHRRWDSTSSLRRMWITCIVAGARSKVALGPT